MRFEHQTRARRQTATSTMAIQILTFLLRNMPLLFGLLFMAPLIAQTIERLNLLPGTGPLPMIIGVVLGGGWGVYSLWNTRAKGDVA